MKSLFKSSLATLLALISVSTMSPSLNAQDCCDPCGNRLYIGGFGGGLFSSSPEFSQMGTAFFLEAQGGPLSVFAEGHAKKKSMGFGGVQLGYEWTQCPFSFRCSEWNITAGAELEAFFYSHRFKGHLINQNDTDRLPEHDFVNSFHSDNSTILGNVVLSFNNPCWRGFTPYIGGGLGAVHLSFHKANSKQVDPPERCINHFNSSRSDSSWAFAAQVKTGLSYKICDSLHIFGEYRYYFVDTSNYIFGSTVYDNNRHAPTSPWNVKLKNIHYNAFTVGIQYDI